MSAVWMAFFVGGFLGCVATVFTLGLCMAARSGDELPVWCHCDHADQGRACKSCRGGDK